MPRTKEQNKKILDKRKHEIIQCAINVFTVKDYKNATVDDITSKLKISHGLFYHYFKNKKDLLKTILDYAEETLMGEFLEIAKNYKDEEFLLHFFETYIRLAKTKEAALLLNLLNNIAKNIMEDRKKDKIPVFERFFNSALYQNLKSLNEKGLLLQPIEVTGQLMFVLVNGIISLAIENRLDKTTLKPKHILKLFVKTAEK